MATEHPSLAAAHREHRESFDEDPAFPALASLQRVLDASSGAAPEEARHAVDDILGVGTVSPLSAPTLASACPTVRLVAQNADRPPTHRDLAVRRALRGAALLLVCVVVGAFLIELALARASHRVAPSTPPPVPAAPPAPVQVTYVTPEPPRSAAPPAVTESHPESLSVRVPAPGVERAKVRGAVTRRARRHAPRPRVSTPPTARGVVVRPDAPDRATVFAHLQGASAQVRACGAGQGGAVTVHLTFASTGRVTTARVVGFPSGPVATCVVSAVRRVTLPAFARPTLTVAMVYVLR